MVHDSYYEKEYSHCQQHGPTQDLTLVEERTLELVCSALLSLEIHITYNSY